MSTFVALSFSGIAYGGIIALVAIGFLVLYKATGVINFAHGDLVTTGAYFGIWALTDLDLGTALAYVLVLVMMFGAGVALERVAYAPLRKASPITVVLSTLGVAIAIRALLGVWQGTTPKDMPSPFAAPGVVHLAGAAISDQRLLVIAVAAVVIGGFCVLFYRTGFGRTLQAMASDREMTQLVGIRVRTLSMVVFGLSAALAGLAGLLVGPLQAVTQNLGFNLMITAFAAAVFGGFGSLGGVVVSSLVVGIVQQVVGNYVLTSYSDVLPFILMVVVLIIRPQGLFRSLAGSRL